MNLDRLAVDIKDSRSGEGRRLFPYTDTAGKTTIGFGHNLTDDGIPAEIAEALYQHDVAQAIGLLSQVLPWTLTLDDVRARVFVELAFNMRGRLLTFKKMLAAAEAHDWHGAYLELLDSLWSRQVQPARRDRLASMLLTGEEL